jgi:hypothetical protein
MANKKKFKFYKICPVCGGTGKSNTGNNIPGSPINAPVCPRCRDETEPFGVVVFDGLRHVYAGRFEEVVTEA